MSNINVLNNGKTDIDVNLLYDEILHSGFKEYSYTTENFSCTLEKNSALITIFIMGASTDSVRSGIGFMTLLVWKDKLIVPNTGIHIQCTQTTSSPFYKFTQRQNLASAVFSEFAYSNRVLSFSPKTIYGSHANIIGYQILYFDK